MVKLHIKSINKEIKNQLEPSDTVIFDPPRKGLDLAIMMHIKYIKPKNIIYLSCNISTLSRDLKFLIYDCKYRLLEIQPIDFFPKTLHVECLAILES